MQISTILNAENQQVITLEKLGKLYLLKLVQLWLNQNYNNDGEFPS